MSVCVDCGRDDCEHAVEELLQEDVETRFPPTPVEVVNVIRTEEMPSRTGGVFTYAVGTGGIRLIGADPRRKAFTVISYDQTFYIGKTQAAVDSPGPASAQWPAQVPLPMPSAEEWWVASSTASTDISVIVEVWND